MKILFVLKYRELKNTSLYSDYSSYGNQTSSGLKNSASFVVEMLEQHGYDVKIVQVVDNNSIDKEVTLYQPDIVFIEALWVVPEKFEVLKKLHPNVKWIIRIHSKIPFLANEGISMQWIGEYIKYDNVYISCNSKNTNNELSEAFRTKSLYLPNCYPLDRVYKKSSHKASDILNIGCFGAIRPLKNHMIQAFAAIQFANKYNKHLRFHINSRVERGQEILKNLRNLFAHTTHELVEHDWLPHDKFLEILSSMDIGLQASYTESFNIVTADYISQNVPIVVGTDIDWVCGLFQCNPNDTKDIIKTMETALRFKKYFFLDLNYHSLKEYIKKSEKIWIKTLKEI